MQILITNQFIHFIVIIHLLFSCIIIYKPYDFKIYFVTFLYFAQIKILK